MYICGYIMKSEKGMGEGVVKKCKNEDIQIQMQKIGKEFLGNRCVGAP